jgi:hypothetical protein
LINGKDIYLIEAAPAFAKGGYSIAPMEQGYFLQPHDEQLQRPGSHEQEQLHWHASTGFRLALRFFG